jgi:hypothetical protein
MLGPPASFTQNFGVVVGQIQPNATTIYPHVGGATNIGILNAGSKAEPTAPAYTTVVSGPAPPAVTGITSTSTTFTVTFASAHGLSAGNTFVLTGFTPSAYNNAVGTVWTVASAVGTTGSGGTYTVTVASTLNPGTTSVNGTASYLTGYLLNNAGTPTLTVVGATSVGFASTSSAGGSLNVTTLQGLFPVTITYTGATSTTFTGCAVTAGLANNICLPNININGAALVWGGSANLYLSGSPVIRAPICSTQALVAVGGAATPTLAAGLYEGQRVIYFNVGGSTITFVRSTTAGNQLYLAAASRALAVGGTLQLMWTFSLGSGGAWLEVSQAVANAN